MRRFLQLASLGFTKMLDFKGRTSLRAYYAFVLLSALLFGLPLLVLSYILPPDVMNIAQIVVLALLAVPFVSLWFRRLHDVDHTSLALAIPFGILAVLRTGQEFTDVPFWFSTIIYAGSLIFIMYIIFLVHTWPGNPDANQFGYIEGENPDE